MGLAEARTRSPQRLAVLCLIAAIATRVLHLVGRCFSRTRWARSLIANTETPSEVLSAIRIGRAVFDELLAPYKKRILEQLVPG